MDDQIRHLTDTEQAILRPLLEKRAALAREQEAVQMGLRAVVQAFAGGADPSVRLDLDSMTLHRQRTPEDAAAEVMALAERKNDAGAERRAEVEASWSGSHSPERDAP